jgi:hypothetical protein
LTVAGKTWWRFTAMLDPMDGHENMGRAAAIFATARPSVSLPVPKPREATSYLSLADACPAFTYGGAR